MLINYLHINELKDTKREKNLACTELVDDCNNLIEKTNELIDRKRKIYNEIVNMRNDKAVQLKEVIKERNNKRQRHLMCWA